MRTVPMHRFLASLGSVLFLTLILAGHVGSPGTMGSPPAPAAVGIDVGAQPAATLVDDSNASAWFNGSLVNVSDTVLYGPATLSSRVYDIAINVSCAEPGALLRIFTHPVLNWETPNQMPWGADNLPSIGYWALSVWSAGSNVTGSWTPGPGNGTVTGLAPWANGTYSVSGRTHPVLPVSVNASQPTATNTPGVSFILNDPNTTGAFPANVTTYPALVDSLHPYLIRFGLATSGADASWSSLGVPRFNFTGYDAAVGLANSSGAPVLLSLPVGTWGDGNLLPAGIPLNTSVEIAYSGLSGYFPTPTAYATFVGAIVNHTLSENETIQYWNIGNEMPLLNQSIVQGYIELFNVAERVIHDAFPTARVGSDVMLNSTYFSLFARDAREVGYLSFHFYPGAGLCVHGGVYCLPQRGNGTATPQLFQPVSSLDQRSFYAPAAAQQAWYNLTGQWLPVFDSESNMNGVGGSTATAQLGTDPRQQSLIGAAWVIYTLMEAADENLTTLAYFTLTGPSVLPTTTTSQFGGWGFGMTRETPQGVQVNYAPYWALQLWSSNLPVGRPGIWTQSADPSVVGAYGGITGQNLTVLLVNQVAAPVTVPLEVRGANVSLTSVQMLDSSSYQELYNPQNATVWLARSSISTQVGANGSAPPEVELNGYAVAVAHFSVRAPASNGTGPGQNGTGNVSGGTPPAGNLTSPVVSGPSGHPPVSGHRSTPPAGSTYPSSGGSPQYFEAQLVSPAVNWTLDNQGLVLAGVLGMIALGAYRDGQRRGARSRPARRRR